MTGKITVVLSLLLLGIILFSGCTQPTGQATLSQNQSKTYCPNQCCVGMSQYYDTVCGSGKECINNQCIAKESNKEALSETKKTEQNQQEQPKEEKPVPKEEPKEKNIGINESVKVDYLTYKIMKAESFTEMGSTLIKKETQGKYVKVYLEITNNSNKSQYIYAPRLTIIDSKGREYDHFLTALMYIADAISFGEQLQPGLTLSGADVFELPKDSTDLKLEIRGDWLSLTKLTVNLTNINDIGKDTTLQEKINKQVDEAMEESQKKMQEALNKCNAPFTCTSNCQEYLGIGQKDCPNGQTCCMET